jgi:hypothetical protein
MYQFRMHSAACTASKRICRGLVNFVERAAILEMLRNIGRRVSRPEHGLTTYKTRNRLLNLGGSNSIS